MIETTQYNLKGLNGGEFQQLMSKLLPRIDGNYEGLVNSGAVEGTAKTRKGTPDIWLKREKNHLICFEITTDEKKSKLYDDLVKCITVFCNEDKKEYICVLNYEPQFDWIKPLQDLCKKEKITFRFIHNTIISTELDKANNQDLRESFLNIPIDKNERYDSFKYTGDSISQMDFSPELKEAYALIKANKILFARERAFSILNKIESKKDIRELEELYRIIADSYLFDPPNQLLSREWIDKLIQITTDEKSKQRRIALSLILSNRYDEAEVIIDNLLANNDCHENVVELKCNIYLNRKKYTEGVIFISSYKKDFKQKHYWYATFYTAQNKYRDAIFYAEKNLEEESNYRNSKLYYDTIVNYLDERFSKVCIDAADFEKAKKLLNKADELLRLIGENIPFERSDILTKKSIILAWLGKHDEALDAINQAYICFPENPTLLRNRAILLSDKNETEAMENLDAYLKLNTDDKTAKKLKYHLMIGKDPEKAVTELTKETRTDKDNIDYIVLLIEAYLVNLQTSEAIKLLDKLKKEKAYKAKISIIESKIYKIKNQLDEAILVLEESYENLDFKSKQEAALILSELYLDKNEEYFYKKNVKLLLPYVNIYILSPFLSVYVLCCFNLHNYEECLEYTVKIRESHGYIAEFIRYEAAIYQLFDNFIDAIPLYKFLITKSPEKAVKYKIELSYCYYRLGEKEKAIDIVEQSKTTQLTIREKILYSKMYASYGSYTESVKYAYMAYSENNNDKDAMENFIGSILFANDRVILEEDVSNKYRLCMAAYIERYPESNFLKKIDMPNDPNEIREYFKNMLSGNKEFIANAEHIYKENKLPISLLSKGVGRDIITTWSYLLFNKDLPIWGESGNESIFYVEKISAIASNECCLDIQSILILDEVGLLYKITSIFKKLYISQSIIDTINKEIDLNKLNIDKGHSCITLSDEEDVYLVEVSKKQLEEKQNWLNRILALVKDDKRGFIVKGKSINYILDPELQQLLGNLEDGESAPIAMALIEKKPVMIGNYILRNILINDKNNVICFGLHAILFKFLHYKIIDEDNYYRILLKLTSLNYKYISIDAKLLIYSLKMNGYLANEQTSTILNLFQDIYWELNSVVKVLIKTLFLLWDAWIDVNLKKKWTMILISSIKMRINTKQFCQIMIKNIESATKQWGYKKRNSIIEMLEATIKDGD